MKLYFASNILVIVMIVSTTPFLSVSMSWARDCTRQEISGYLKHFSQSDSLATNSVIECGQLAIPDLVQLLDNSNVDVKIQAIYTLGQIAKNPEKVVPAITNKLSDPDPDIRANAAFALGNIGSKDPIATAALLKILKTDSAHAARAESASALGVVSEGDKIVVAALIKALKDSGLYVSTNAAYSLGNLGLKAKNAVDPLIDILKNKNKNNDFRAGAAYSLGRIDHYNKKIALVLRSSLKDDNLDVRYKSATSLVDIVHVLSNDAKTVQQVDFVLEIANELSKDLAAPGFEERYQDIHIIIASLTDRKTVKQTQEAIKWIEIGKQVWAVHALFWLGLIFVYPKSPQVQAIFFWNPWIRNILGIGYVTFLLQWTPYLRRKLFAPFRHSLLADAGLDSFNPALYFPESKVSLKGSDQIQSLTTIFSQIQGQIILEGSSGLGKTMFVRHLLKDAKRIVVYLPATKCTEGVIGAIQMKLHGDEIKDLKFLQSLIYSGAIDICIDGLNEVSADTRAKITQFVESYFRGNILITTQPLEWTPPATAKAYRLHQLNPDQIEHYLISRQSLLPQNSSIKGTAYKEQCQAFINQIINNSLTSSEVKAVQSIISNPMELTLAAWAISAGKTPDLFHLREQQYEMMAAEYQHLWNQEFPLRSFSEAIYQLWLADKRALPATEFFNELCCMADEKFRMVVSRQWKDAEGKAKQEWYFRHEKIAEFFTAQTFLGEGDEAKKRLYDHMGDSRFRGVYFLLATLMPEAAAKQLREDLIHYAAETKDHNISDDFVLLFDSRRSL
jgi:HEAT repeat protein